MSTKEPLADRWTGEAMYAVEDHAAIHARLRELEMERRGITVPKAAPSEIGKRDSNDFDVLCRQPDPAELGIIDNGDGHIVIPRSLGVRRDPHS